MVIQGKKNTGWENEKGREGDESRTYKNVHGKQFKNRRKNNIRANTAPNSEYLRYQYLPMYQST